MLARDEGVDLVRHPVLEVAVLPLRMVEEVIRRAYIWGEDLLQEVQVQRWLLS